MIRFKIAFFALLLLSCAKEISPPHLSNNRNNSKIPIIKGEKISAPELEEIFSFINKNGKLDSLKQLVNDNSLTYLLNKHLYEDAFKKDGFLISLDSTINNRLFSQLSANISTNSFKRIMGIILKQEKSLELIEKDVYFIPWLERFSNLTKNYFHKISKIQCQECSIDKFKSIVSDNSFKESISKLINNIWGNEISIKLINSLRVFNNKYGTYGLEKVLSNIKEALSTGSYNPQKLTAFDNLLELLDVLNGSSSGIFKNLDKILEKQPELLSRMSVFIYELPSKSIKRILLNKLVENQTYNKDFWIKLGSKCFTAPPSKESIEIYINIRTSIEYISGRISGEDVLNIYKLPIYLNSYVLMKWFEKFSSDNLEKIKSIPEKDFSVILKDTSFHFSELKLNFIGKENSFDSNIFKDFETLGLKDVAQYIHKLISAGAIEKSFYYIPPFENHTLDLALEKLFSKIHAIRPFSEISPFFNSIIFSLANKGFFSNFETENMLVELNKFIASQKFENVQKMKEVLFKDIRLGSLSEDDKAFILSLYFETPELQEKLLKLLNSLNAVEFFDHSSPSPFELYHTFISHFPSKDLEVISRLVTFLAEIFKFKDGKRQYELANFITKNIDYLNELMKLLSELKEEEASSFVLPFINAFGPKDASGIKLHFEILKELFSSNDFEIVLNRISKFDMIIPQSILNWFFSFVTSGDLRLVVTSLKNLKVNWLTFFSDLQSLGKDGTITEISNLLSLIKNERIKYLAKILGKLQNSGELTKLLELLIFLNNN